MNYKNPTKMYQIISKHGTVDINMETDADIADITADGRLLLTQKAQNLTIRNLGMADPSRAGIEFNDMLYPQRNNYTMQRHNYITPSKFQNKFDRLAFYDYDFKANDVVLSIGDYSDVNNVSVDTLYANNAYINTSAQNFKIEDGIITNYAEFRNSDKLGIVDNNFRRLLATPNIQLYTQKTGMKD